MFMTRFLLGLTPFLKAFYVSYRDSVSFTLGRDSLSQLEKSKVSKQLFGLNTKQDNHVACF